MSFLSEPAVDGCRLVGPNSRAVHTRSGLPGTRTLRKQAQLFLRSRAPGGVDGRGGIRTGRLRCSSEGFDTLPYTSCGLTPVITSHVGIQPGLSLF